MSKCVKSHPKHHKKKSLSESFKSRRFDPRRAIGGWNETTATSRTSFEWRSEDGTTKGESVGRAARDLVWTEPKPPGKIIQKSKRTQRRVSSTNAMTETSRKEETKTRRRKRRKGRSRGRGKAVYVPRVALTRQRVLIILCKLKCTEKKKNVYKRRRNMSNMPSQRRK